MRETVHFRLEPTADMVEEAFAFGQKSGWAEGFAAGYEAGRKKSMESTLRDNGDEPPEGEALLAALDEMLEKVGA